MFGGHLCALCHNEAEEVRVATVFLREGLATGERVACLGGDRLSGPLRAAMVAAGVPADLAAEAGQLVSDAGADLTDGAGGNVQEVARSIRAAARQARADGFPGLRLAVQIGHLAKAWPGRLDEWERSIDGLCRADGITICCQYGPETAAVGDDVLGRHRGAVSGRTGAPLAIMLATVNPWGWRVEGELDISNRDDFADALVARLAVNPELCLDLSRLTFIDMGSLTLLFTVAAELPPAGRIQVIGASPHLQRVIQLSGFSHPRVVVEGR